MNNIKWFIFSAVTIGILVFLVIFSNGSKIDVSNIDVNAVQIASESNGNIGDHIFGKVGSKVTLIEYADYQCPGCGTINPSVKDIIETYKDQIQFIFRNFPLTSIHPNAKSSAAAAEAAGLQGKFWEMHDRIYASQYDWENLGATERTDYYAKLANELGIDTVKFKTDMASSSMDKKISFDQAIGYKAKVSATPSFFLNGTLLDGKTWGESAKFKEAINNELAKFDIELPKTVE